MRQYEGGQLLSQLRYDLLMHVYATEKRWEISEHVLYNGTVHSAFDVVFEKNFFSHVLRVNCQAMLVH